MTMLGNDNEADDSLLDGLKEKLDKLKGKEGYKSTEIDALCQSNDSLSRFLVARNNHLDKAAAMATKALAWRSRVQPATLTIADFPTAQPQGVWRFAGTAKNGWPILLVKAAPWEPSQYSVDEYVKMVAYYMEQNIQKNPTGHNFIIFDMRGLGYLKTDLRKTRQLMAILNDYYPERLGVAVAVYCDWVFDKLVGFAKAFVDKRTADKVIDFRDNGADFLHQHVDLDQLTKDFGGSREEEWPLEEEVPVKTETAS